MSAAQFRYEATPYPLGWRIRVFSRRAPEPGAPVRLTPTGAMMLTPDEWTALKPALELAGEVVELPAEVDDPALIEHRKAVEEARRAAQSKSARKPERELSNTPSRLYQAVHGHLNR